MATLILRLTAKLLKLIGEPLDADPGDGQEWYGNLIWIERRKCLLFTHAATLFSLLVPDVRKADITPFRTFALERIDRELASENLSPVAFGVGAGAEVVVARTSDRSVLGSMNDLAFQCQYAVTHEGGLAELDVPALNKQLREIPMGALKGAAPIDIARAHSSGSPGTAIPGSTSAAWGSGRKTK